MLNLVVVKTLKHENIKAKKPLFLWYTHKSVSKYLIKAEKLVEKISEANICLGIFGKTQKTQRVIPNKLYECIAMKKPVLTASSDAILEKFDNYDNILLCNIADSNDLAAKILELKNNHDLLDKIAENGYSLFTKEFSSEVLGKKLIDIIKQ